MTYHQPAKLFALWHISFSIAHDDTNQSTEALNTDIDVILGWVYQWKMSFNNPDKSKQTQVVVFSRKTSKVAHSLASFDNCPVAFLL